MLPLVILHLVLILTICHGKPTYLKDKFKLRSNQNLINALDPEETNIQKSVPDDKLDDPVQLIKPNKAVKADPSLVRRPDHLDGVPLERDGHLNKQFRREVVLGQDDSNDDLEVDLAQKTLEMFIKADTNRDKNLDEIEIKNLIHLNTLKHLDDSVIETKKIFKEIDQNEDGKLSWDGEYHYHFVVDNKMMDKDHAKKHNEDEHNNDDQERLEFEHESWNAADLNDDGYLDEAEFLAFRHPEHSQKMLQEMVADIIRSLDTSEVDGQLSENEFAMASIHGQVEEEWAKQEAAYIDERRTEFKEAINTNHDKFASKQELLEYSNPRNEQHARRETKELMEIADENHDNLLSLDEIMAHKEMFIDSGLVHPARKMHDEM